MSPDGSFGSQHLQDGYLKYPRSEDPSSDCKQASKIKWKCPLSTTSRHRTRSRRPPRGVALPSSITPHPSLKANRRSPRRCRSCAPRRSSTSPSMRAGAPRSASRRGCTASSGNSATPAIAREPRDVAAGDPGAGVRGRGRSAGRGDGEPWGRGDRDRSRPRYRACAALDRNQQHAIGFDSLNACGICPPDRFAELVRFEAADMRDVKDRYSGYNIV